MGCPCAITPYSHTFISAQTRFQLSARKALIHRKLETMRGVASFDRSTRKPFQNACRITELGEGIARKVRAIGKQRQEQLSARRHSCDRCRVSDGGMKRRQTSLQSFCDLSYNFGVIRMPDDPFGVFLVPERELGPCL
jgi:hypothetical protein